MNNQSTRLLSFATFFAFAVSSLLAQTHNGHGYPSHGGPRSAAECREEIEAGTRRALERQGREMRVTSRHRENSEAHRRGAIDVSVSGWTREQMHAAAAEISEELLEHNVVVEEVYQPAPGHEGPSGQRNTTYRNGRRGNSRALPIAPGTTGTHIHVQPDRGRCVPPARRAPSSQRRR